MTTEAGVRTCAVSAVSLIGLALVASCGNAGPIAYVAAAAGVLAGFIGVLLAKQ